MLGGDGSRQRDHERDRQTERVRAGDDEHGHGRLDRALHVARQRPGDERHRRGPGRDVEQQRREAIGEHLGPTPAGLGVGDEALDAGERGVLPHRVDLDAHRRVGRHGPGDHPSPTVLATGRDSPVIIDSSSSASPSMIRPSAGTRAPDRTNTRSPAARASIGTSSIAPSAVDPLGLVRQECSERGERTVRLTDRLHLLPVPEQHDRHEQRELPPELEVEPAEGRRHRRHPGDGDRHRDQQHHPRLPVADLGDGTGEERLAAPGEDERAEHRPDPGDAVELVAEPLHHHLAGDDDRDRQQERQPEPAPEGLRIVTGVLVVRRGRACRDPADRDPGGRPRRDGRLRGARRSHAHVIYPRGVSVDVNPKVWQARSQRTLRSDIGRTGGYGPRDDSVRAVVPSRWPHGARRRAGSGIGAASPRASPRSVRR